MDPQISRGFQLSGIEEPTFRRTVRRRVITAVDGIEEKHEQIGMEGAGDFMGLSIGLSEAWTWLLPGWKFEIRHGRTRKMRGLCDPFGLTPTRALRSAASNLRAKESRAAALRKNRESGIRTIRTITMLFINLKYSWFDRVSHLFIPTVSTFERPTSPSLFSPGQLRYTCFPPPPLHHALLMRLPAEVPENTFRATEASPIPPRAARASLFGLAGHRPRILLSHHSTIIPAD